MHVMAARVRTATAGPTGAMSEMNKAVAEQILKSMRG
jgi:hypothetical protein